MSFFWFDSAKFTEEAAGIEQPIGLSSESDSAFGIFKSKSKSIGLVSETSISQPINKLKNKNIAQSTESDSAFGIGRVRSLPVGLCVEVDNGLPLQLEIVQVIGLSIETDTVTDIISSKIKSINLALETNNSFDISVDKFKSINLSSETDTVTGIEHSRSKSVSFASETDNSFDISIDKFKTIGLALETDISNSISNSSSKSINLALETDSSFAISVDKFKTISLATESDTAQTVASIDTLFLIGDQGYDDFRPNNLDQHVDASAAVFHMNQTTNPYPFHIDDAPGGGLILTGGQILGEVLNIDWEDAYPIGNSAAIRLENTPNMIIRNWYIRNCWDGIRPTTNCAGFVIENTWVDGCRDDAVENDSNQPGTINNCLFEGFVCGISTTGLTSGSIITFNDCLLHSRIYEYETEFTHQSPFKAESGEPNPTFILNNTVVAIELTNHEGTHRLQAAFDNMTVTGDSYYLNLSDTPLNGSYPDIPSGFTILEGAPARELWQSLRTQWIANFGLGITHVATTGFTLSGATGVKNIAFPVPALPDEVVLVGLVCDNAMQSVPILTDDYNDIESTPDGSGPANAAYLKRMISSSQAKGYAADNSIDFDYVTGSVIAGFIRIYRGSSDNPVVWDDAFVTDTIIGGMPDAPSHEAQEGSLRIIIGYLDDDDVASSVTAPSGWSNLFAKDTEQVSTSVGSTIMIADKVALSSGFEDPDVFGGTGNDAWKAMHFSLLPAPASPAINVEIGLTTEVSIVQSITHSRLRSINQIIETDISNGIDSYKLKQFGLATESESAQTIAYSKDFGFGQATEIDLSTSVSHYKIKSIGISEQSDIALGIGFSGAINLGQATEIEFSQSIQSSKIKSINQSIEVSIVLPFSTGKLLPINSIEDSQQSAVIIPLRLRQFSISEEIDNSIFIQHSKIIHLQTISEQNISLSVRPQGSYDVNVVDETNSSSNVIPLRARSTGLSIENDISFDMILDQGPLTPSSRIISGGSGTRIISSSSGNRIISGGSGSRIIKVA
jgi:hypothetical protein